MVHATSGPLQDDRFSELVPMDFDGKGMAASAPQGLRGRAVAQRTAACAHPVDDPIKRTHEEHEPSGRTQEPCGQVTGLAGDLHDVVAALFAHQRLPCRSAALPQIDPHGSRWDFMSRSSGCAMFKATTQAIRFAFGVAPMTLQRAARARASSHLPC